jgi:CRP/FNR family transcriptional regulator
VATLAGRSHVIRVPQAERLATEGESADRFGLVVTGKVRVYYVGADGRQITYEIVGPGEPFAVVAALAGTRHPANVEATMPATIAFIPASALLGMLDAEPNLARTLITDLANRVVNFSAVVQTLAQDVPSRVANYLFQRALRTGRPAAAGLDVSLGMKKGELAMALGTVPETLSRAFAKLREDGVLEVHGQRVTVLDMRALAAMAAGYSEG